MNQIKKLPPMDEVIPFDEKFNKYYFSKNDVKKVYYFDSQTNSLFKINVEEDAINDKIYLNVISSTAQRQYDLIKEGICIDFNKTLGKRMDATTFRLRTTLAENEEVLVQKTPKSKAWQIGRVVKFVREKREVIIELLTTNQNSRSNKIKTTVPFQRVAYFVSQHLNLSKAFRIISKVYSKGGQVNFLSGLILDLAKKANNMRYLVFFDCGITSYVNRKDVAIILEQSKGFEHMNAFQREFMSYYFKQYPEVPLAKFKIGEKSLIRMKMPNQSDELYVRAKGEVTKIDCKLVQFYVQSHNSHVWLFRGDYTRIVEIQCSEMRDELKRQRPIRNIGFQHSVIEVTIDEDLNEVLDDEDDTIAEDEAQPQVEIEQPSIQPLVDLIEKSSISITDKILSVDILSQISLSRIVKHKCSENCLDPQERENKLAKSISIYIIPILFGWRRLYDIRFDHTKHIFYLSPCGIKFYDMESIFDYLQITNSKLQIDQFNLDRNFVIDEDESGKKVELNLRKKKQRALKTKLIFYFIAN